MSPHLSRLFKMIVVFALDLVNISAVTACRTPGRHCSLLQVNRAGKHKSMCQTSSGQSTAPAIELQLHKSEVLSSQPVTHYCTNIPRSKLPRTGRSTQAGYLIGLVFSSRAENREKTWSVRVINPLIINDIKLISL